MTLLERFHQVTPENKWEVVATLGDARLRYLAERLIFEEWPAKLPLDVYARIDANLRDRQCAVTECPWTTISDAMEATEELLLSADEHGRAILVQYREYLMGLSPATPRSIDIPLHTVREPPQPMDVGSAAL
jgi:hypothetical protein